MAEHGVGGGGIAGMGAQMAVGVGMGNVMAQGFAPQVPQQMAPAPTFSPGGTQVTCGKCGAKQPGGKFCAELRDAARRAEEVLQRLRRRDGAGREVLRRLRHASASARRSAWLKSGD